MKRQVTTNINPVLTVQELQELETKVLEYKNKILEILGKESELVKDINTRDGLFDEIKIKIKTSSELKQWIQNKELMSLLSQ
jgi:ABC-type Fe3+-citrate transport system substrate-binding protein